MPRLSADEQLVLMHIAKSFDHNQPAEARAQSVCTKLACEKKLSQPAYEIMRSLAEKGSLSLEQIGCKVFFFLSDKGRRQVKRFLSV